LVLIAGFGLSSPAVAQTTAGAEKFIIEALPDRFSRRVESQRKMLRQFGLADPDKTQRGVINALKIWTADYPIVKVCFYPSPQRIRVRIARIAMEWKSVAAGLPLDFGNLSNSRLCKRTEVNHIRVGYAYSGYWSLVGTDSIRLAGQEEQSINLQYFDQAPPDEREFRSTVLHEFGHAIGLEHEHQNPLSMCRDEFDWPKIYKWLGGPPNNWSKETVDFNMGILNEKGLQATEFDKKSIMLYTFPASYFRNGAKASCYNELNITLSLGDRDIVNALYPVNQAARIALVDRIREHHLALVEASRSAKGAKSGVIQLINEYMPKR